MAKIPTRCLSVCFFRNILRPGQFLFSSNYCSSNVLSGDGEKDTFPELFGKSQFAKLVRPADKVVLGEISHVVNDDLYIDIGWKFHAVIKANSEKRHSGATKTERIAYSVGDMVEVKINELEMTGHFLGQHKRITLCEADVTLVEDEK